MPHLAKLASQYKKVTFLSVSDESVEIVKTFLAKPSRTEGKTWGEAMAFTVATDPDGSTKKDLHERAGGGGIPNSFIISGGIVQWVGHPMTMDVALKAIVAGTWDPMVYKKQQEHKVEAERLKRDLRPLIGMASSEGWKPVIAKIDETLKKSPNNGEIVAFKFQLLLLGARDEKAAYALSPLLLKTLANNSATLNELAWLVVDDKRLKTRDLDFALAAALQANKLTASKNPAIMDTLARAYHMKAQHQQALKWQRLAVKHAEGDPALQKQLAEALQEYEKLVGGK